MSIAHASAPQFAKMLQNLSSWLEKAERSAKERSFDVDVLAGARLAPDMYRLTQQVQSACDTAKLAVARLTGREAPKHPDTETTVAELKKRVATVVDYLGTFQAADFKGAEDRLVELPYFEGKVLRGEDYLVDIAQPNFYFHVSMAYAILRHNGVPLGKPDFVGMPRLRDK